MRGHRITVKELYDWAIEHGKEDYAIAVECGGLEVDRDVYNNTWEFQGIACIVDDRLDKYYYTSRDIVPAVWLCCADGELYEDEEDRSAADYLADRGGY